MVLDNVKRTILLAVILFHNKRSSSLKVGGGNKFKDSPRFGLIFKPLFLAYLPLAESERLQRVFTMAGCNTGPVWPRKKSKLNLFSWL